MTPQNDATSAFFMRWYPPQVGSDDAYLVIERATGEAIRENSLPWIGTRAQAAEKLKALLAESAQT